MEAIITSYRTIIQESELQLQKARKYIRHISLLRLLLFTGAVAGAISFWSDGWISLLWAAFLPFLLFIWLMKIHNKWFYKKDFYKKKIEINQQEIKAINYDYSAFDNGMEYNNPAHLYSYDLDVFGEHSLFQSINRTSTPIGKQKLADWFNQHLESKEAIEYRQEGVRELSSDLTFRQLFRLYGLLFKGTPADTTEIYEWANSNNYHRTRALFRMLPLVVGLLNFACITLALTNILPGSIAGGVFVCFIVLSFTFSKGITKTQNMYGVKLQILSTYAEQILLTEQKEMSSSALKALKEELTSQGQSASKTLLQLSKQMNALDQRNNMFISAILNGLFFWELWQVMRIEKWKETHAENLPKWIQAIGEMDAYCSLATFAYNHPLYIYPKITATPFRLKGEELGHPLMNRDKCVPNGIDIIKRPYFIIITGANMAGKSTYLRTIGTNYLLACIGAPVWAKQMEIYPARLVTSLRTSDSLTDNESYFFAELKRLKMIIDKLQSGEELFIILDEILKGTNSMDKQKGSFALVKQLMSLQANGIIATHDLLLGTLSKSFPDDIRNFCFEADITQDELTFSYRMRDGVAQNMNACFLMKKMGIAIIDN